MKTLRTLSFIVAVLASFILNAKAQTSYVTLVATNGQQVSYSVPANKLATVIHLSPPNGTAIYEGYYYSINVSIAGTSTDYYPVTPLWDTTTPVVNNNFPVVCGPAIIKLNNPGAGDWGTVICTIQLTTAKTVTVTR